MSSVTIQDEQCGRCGRVVHGSPRVVVLGDQMRGYATVAGPVCGACAPEAARQAAKACGPSNKFAWVCSLVGDDSRVLNQGTFERAEVAP
jgi:hypothetical protein